MPQWLIGLIVPIALGAAVSALVGAMNRYATEGLGANLARWYWSFLKGWKIPVVSGDAETKLKHQFVKTPLDITRGFVKELDRLEGGGIIEPPLVLTKDGVIPVSGGDKK